MDIIKYIFIFLDYAGDKYILDNVGINRTLLSETEKNIVIAHWKKYTKFEYHQFYDGPDHLLKHWLVNDKLHREDGPAEECIHLKAWYINGKLHRTDGPARINSYGDKEWYWHDLRHRIDGPAVEEVTGINSWWKYGKRHRINGPAVEYPDGRVEWWANNERINERIK